jgi:hypothetical protein
LSESGLVLSLAEAYPGLKDEEDKNALDLSDLEITLIKSKTKSRTNRTSSVPIINENTGTSPLYLSYSTDSKVDLSMH